MRTFLSPRRLLAAALLAFASFALFATMTRAQEDQGVLAGFISKILSTPASRVSIGAIDGALSSQATIRDITVADPQGVYLRIDTVRISWTRAALLSRRIDIQNLEIGRVEFSRRPAPGDGAPPSDAPLLPELPLKVEVGKFALAELALGEPVIGVAARFSANGSASLGAPSEGLRATFDVNRLDAPGRAALRLSFAPATQQLDLNLQHEEPAGGIAARLFNIPGLPPVKLALAGAGTLDDWRATLAFDGGAGLDARGDARLARAGALRRLTLNVQAHLEPLLPPAASAVFAGALSLAGDTTFGDDGAIGLEQLRLASQIAELTATGRLAADKTLDATIAARALPTDGGATRRGATSLAQLSLNATAKGPLAAPQVDGALTLRGLSSPALALGALDASLSLQPIANASAQRFRLAADGKAAGLSLADPGLSEALGDSATLVVRGVVDDKGVADLTDARISSPNLAFSFNGLAGAALLNGRARGEITRLSAFSTLASRPLAGRAALQMAVQGDPSRSAINATLDGVATELSLGDAIADRLTGRRVTLTGSARTAPGAVTLDKLTAQGRFISATLDGRLAANDLDLGVALSLPDLAKADARLSGAARVEARATGEAADPSVTLTASSAAMTALGKPLRNMALNFTGRRLVAALDLAAKATGDVDGKPLAVDVKAAGTDGGWTLDTLLLRLGSVSANARGRLAPSGLASGEATVAAGDLDDLSPLVLTPLRGSANARLTADAADGKQRVVIEADGRRIAVGAATLNALKTSLRVDDLFGRITIDGDATVDRLAAAGETVENVALAARGASGASDLSLTAKARGFDLSAKARLLADDAKRLDLQSFAATRAGARIALSAPATLTFVDGGVRAERLAVAALGGDVELRGLVGRDLDLSLAIRRMPLTAVDVLAPQTGLRGVLDAQATLKGPASAPRGPFQATVKGLSAPQTRAAGLPALDISAQGDMQGERAAVKARVAGGRAISFDIDGWAPLNENGAFDLRGRGALDASLANALLAASGQRVSGRVTIDGALRGTRARPDVQGTAVLTGGAFTDPLQGVALTGVEGRASGRGDAVTIDRVRAKTKNGGVVDLSGRVTVDADRGFPADLKISATDAELVSSDLATLVAGLNLTISGPLASAPRLSGRIDVKTLEIRVPDRLPSASEPLRDARHIKPPPQTRARLAQIARQKAAAKGGRRATPFNAALDLAIDAPGRIFVRGRGIDAELGGNVRVAGTSNDPRAQGAFDLRRGRLSILTQRLDFTRGRATFGGGDIVPDLDLVAETTAGGVTARVAVTGRATEPTFAISSSPDLPQDEVLSRLLFARASGGLSPFQAVQLAQAVAQLSGASGGPDVFEQARRALGVDDLDVGMGTGGPTVGLSRAISDRVRIGVKAGAKPESSSVGADIDLTRHLKAQTEIGADGRASVGIGAEIDY